jgi:hypothetical protein
MPGPTMRRTTDPFEKSLGRPGKLLDTLARWYTGGDPVNELAAPMIPLDLAKFSKVIADHASPMVESSASSILKRLLKSKLPDERIGSSSTAQIASGVVPYEAMEMGGLERAQALRAELASRQSPAAARVRTILDTRRAATNPPPPVARAEPSIPRSERRVAQEEMYRITQELLEKAGIGADQTVTLHRGGRLSPSRSQLTPTTVDPRAAENWAAMHQQPDFVSYEVPRKQVRALAGILGRGDDLTLSEMLIPSHVLKKSAVAGTPEVSDQLSNIMRGVSGRSIRRLPSRAGKK